MARPPRRRSDSDSDFRYVVVGRLGRPHGVRGDIHVVAYSDVLDERLVPGSTVESVSPEQWKSWADRSESTIERLITEVSTQLTVESLRWHSSRCIVRFSSIADRDGLEAVRGRLLVCRVMASESPADPDEFFDWQLVGLTVRAIADPSEPATEAEEWASVTSVWHGPVQDVLVLTDSAGTEVLVPFVTELVPTVDLDAGWLMCDRPTEVGDESNHDYGDLPDAGTKAQDGVNRAL